uniref:Si:ch211-220f12.4 n=1 Tax=Cyclopterus lumpus TaxID=8103 RepID=A0A8C3A2V6_CYCLU
MVCTIVRHNFYDILRQISLIIPTSFLLNVVWLGDEGVEIKRQITGMMRLLSDKTGRVHHRVVTEQDRDPGPSPSSISTSIPNADNHLPTPYGLPADVDPPAVTEAPCCMCNCKGTLQAILQELRAMRRLMHTQKGKWMSTNTHILTRRAALGPLAALPLIVAPAVSGKREECEKEQGSSTPNSHSVSSEVSLLPPQKNPVTINNRHNPLLNQLKEHQSIESEVRLAEDHNVYISKAQLDSILVNYTRSGSLLFRKLVCAFFDDTTLANSLPNGKRKRGLNDNRKGLDQNIVGAIKGKIQKT